MDSIAKTSLLTAAMRAVETSRSDEQGRLFVDPYAELLAGEEGKNILQQAIAAAGDQPAIAIRTAFIDQKINEAIKAEVTQFVFLAAGMDTRCYRLDFSKDSIIYELDRKEVFEYKLNKLNHVKPVCHRVTIDVDLRDSWCEQLMQKGFNTNKQTLWLVEGLLMYLTEENALTLLHRINSMAKEKDILLLDILSQTLLQSPFMKNQLNFLSSIGAPWYFGVNEPEQFFASLGWQAQAVQAGEFAPHRWPFPVAPRHVPNVPRGFYVSAVKI